MDSPPSHQLQMLQNRGKELLKENVYMLKIVFVKIKCTGLLTQPWLTNFQSQESQLLCWAWVLHLKARWLFGDEVLQDAQQHPQPPLQDVTAPLCQSWQPKCIQTSPSISWGTKSLWVRPSTTGNIANLRPWFLAGALTPPGQAEEFHRGILCHLILAWMWLPCLL